MIPLPMVSSALPEFGSFFHRWNSCSIAEGGLVSIVCCFSSDNLKVCSKHSEFRVFHNPGLQLNNEGVGLDSLMYTIRSPEISIVYRRFLALLEFGDVPEC